VRECQSDRLERKSNVLERLPGLGGEIANGDNLIVRIERDLTGNVDRMAAGDLHHL
jgi:hypothetical protein